MKVLPQSSTADPLDHAFADLVTPCQFWLVGPPAVVLGEDFAYLLFGELGLWMVRAFAVVLGDNHAVPAFLHLVFHVRFVGSQE